LRTDSFKPALVFSLLCSSLGMGIICQQASHVKFTSAQSLIEPAQTTHNWQIIIGQDKDNRAPTAQ